MKKILSLAGIIALAAIVSTSAHAGNTGTGNPINPMDRQAFYDSTAALRASLAADQAELNALMSGNNPDPKRARALSESISKSQDELMRQAGSQAPMMGYSGSHMGMNNAHNRGPYTYACGCMGGCMW